MNTNTSASCKSQINEEIAGLKISVEEIDKNLEALCIKLVRVLSVKDRQSQPVFDDKQPTTNLVCVSSSLVPLAEEIESIRLDVVKANNKIRSIVSSCEL